MEFTNADVAAKYNYGHSKDPIVHVPGAKNKNGWKGNLTTIPLEAADRLYAMGSNLLTLKTEPTPPAVNKANKPAVVKTDDNKT